MHILHVSNFFPKHHRIWGGAEQICLRCIDLLKQQGLDISLLTTPADVRAKEDFKTSTIKTLKNYLAPLLKGPFLLMKSWGLLLDPFSFFCFNKILKKDKPDIIHFHKIEEFSLLLVLSAVFNKIPSVMTIYDYYYLCPKETLIKDDDAICRVFNTSRCVKCIGSKRFNFLKAFLLCLRKKIFNYLLKKINAFVVLSESSRFILESAGINKDKIFVIRQPFIFDEVRDNKCNNGNTILFIGWLQPRKGVGILIEAVKHVIAELKDVKLIIAGDIQDKCYEEKIRNLIKSCKLADNVSILGKVPYGEVKRILKGASVVVIPEQWENMSPAVLIEAMYFKKPVVASNIGGIPEFIKNGVDGFLVEPRDAQGFARAIVKLLKNKEKAEEVGCLAGEKITELFNKKNTIGQLIKLYEEMVKA